MNDFINKIIRNREKPVALKVDTLTSTNVPTFKKAQVKLDGHRLTIAKDADGELYAIGRKRNENLIDKVRACLPQETIDAINSLPNSTAVDGEIYSPNKSSNYVSTALAKGGSLSFSSWACVFLSGERAKNLEKLSTFDRQSELLSFWGFEGVSEHSYPGFMNFILPHVERIVEAKGVEGYVFKCNPLHTWYKWKPVKTIDLVIMGFVEGNGQFDESLGALRLGYWNPEKGKLVHFCNVGSGLTKELRKRIWSDKEHYKNKSVEIAYDTIQKTGPRFPRFRSFRDDKPLEECLYEANDG